MPNNDDGIWMFINWMQDDVNAGIDRAIQEKGGVKGRYANKLNQIQKDWVDYMDPKYTTPSGNKLGSSGRRELIKSYCLDDFEAVELLLQ